MKRSMFAALLFSLAIAGCAADAGSDPSAESGDDEAAAASAVAPVEHVDTRLARTGLDSSKYCLPGEVVKCTLGPPPVCSCVPAPKTTTTTTLYAW